MQEPAPAVNLRGQRVPKSQRAVRSMKSSWGRTGSLLWSDNGVAQPRWFWQKPTHAAAAVRSRAQL
eukprot:SAG11_NODE_1723_length_4373_cov_8.121666_2_plen_66_part_00